MKLPGDVFGNNEAQTPEAEEAKEEEKAVKFNEWSSKNVQEYGQVIVKEPDIDNPSEGTLNALEHVGEENFTFLDIKSITKEDGTIDKAKYQEASKEFAKDILESWNKDKEEGVNLEEYTDPKLVSLGISDTRLEELGEEKAEALQESIESSFNFLDINGNGVVEDSEMQNVLTPQALEEVKNNILNE